jgi:hypothetical protein
MNPAAGHNTGEDMPMERLAILENEVKHLRLQLEERDRLTNERMTNIEASYENIERTLRDVAGLIRDQATEKRLLAKTAHVVGWIVAALGGWASHYYFK